MCKLFKITFDRCNITYKRVEVCGRFSTGLRCIAIAKAVRIMFVDSPFNHDHRVPYDDSEPSKGCQDLQEGYSRYLTLDGCNFWVKLIVPRQASPKVQTK